MKGPVLHPKRRALFSLERQCQLRKTTGNSFERDYHVKMRRIVFEGFKAFFAAEKDRSGIVMLDDRPWGIRNPTVGSQGVTTRLPTSRRKSVGRLFNFEM